MEKLYASFLSLLNNGNIVGHSGIAYNSKGEPVKLTEDELCYAMFLYDLEMQLLDRKKNWGFDLEKKTRFSTSERVVELVDASIREITDYYNKTYASQRLSKKKTIRLLSEDKLGVGVYTLQYILRLNGYEIDTDKSIKELNDELSCSKGDTCLPIRPSKEKLNENSIIIALGHKGLKANSSCAFLYDDAVIREASEKKMERFN